MSDYIAGRRAIRELLVQDPGRIDRIWVARSSESVSGIVAEILQLAKNKNVAVQEEANRQKLSEYSGSDSHQGIVARIKPRLPISISSVLDRQKSHSCILCLDSIQDPQNLGSLFRVAECFGVDALMYSTNRSASVTATVRKASVGATELVDRIEIANLSTGIKKLQEAGYWVVGSLCKEGATFLSDFEFPKKCVLIMGSEEKGIRPGLEKQVDYPVTIPLAGQIESLNVSQAASIFLYALHSQHYSRSLS